MKNHLRKGLRDGLKHSYPLGYCFKGTLWQESRILDKGWGRRITNIYKSCYLHIKCFLANSLAALMWRWYLNSEQAALQLVVESSGRWFGNLSTSMELQGFHYSQGKIQSAAVQLFSLSKKSNPNLQNNSFYILCTRFTMGYKKGVKKFSLLYGLSLKKSPTKECNDIILGQVII